ncbi:isochorismate synthase [Humidisolicoccus flavus]|uniref:isochorismate synthase n=1 Tax=Humidisolicoccus flavus TaxID=3111414 RepID=UPI00325623FA
MRDLPRLTATTHAISRPDLFALLQRQAPLAFMRGSDGVIGIGTAFRADFSGADRILDAASTWDSLCDQSQENGDYDTPGTGLTAFGAMSFASDSSAKSTLLVPKVVVGTRGDFHWMTKVQIAGEAAPAEPQATPLQSRPQLELVPGSIGPEAYTAAVAAAVSAITSGQAEKLVIARDLSARWPADADLRAVLRSLNSSYPTAITYAVDGVFGATPETLVRAEHGEFHARVLAGTAARNHQGQSRAEQELVTNLKNQREHAFAVDSAVDALAGLIDVRPEGPFVLELPNVLHLATDLRGTMAQTRMLDLVNALHPTAAVAGTPRSRALELIQSIEQIDRRRYAGPVGWMDSRGNGEWAIALRGAELHEGRVRAFAGAGIVADSDPQEELTETAAKFRPILGALGRAFE